MKKEKYCSKCGMKLNKDGVCSCTDNCKCNLNTKNEKYNKTGLIIVLIISFIYLIGFLFIGRISYSIGKLIYNVINDEIKYEFDDDIENKFDNFFENFDIREESYEVNEEFLFENYKIEISDDYKILNIEDATLIKIPVKIKNNGKKRHFKSEKYSVYNPDDSYNKIIGHLFDNSLENIDYLDSFEEVVKYIYLTYEEDGDYIIEFESTRKNITVKINITK